ncbi:unnamed protein product [Symbiodinium necroappetens]|uniref:GRIP domain-containing protein n=1 Tax=Symbiodinium necroappetens TaxID=1628268 RepID=A0A812PSP7_9DINO|nr:unnamed protein product [Symbiodinium necroappetens]
MLQMSYAQEKVLKDRIRELESSQGRTHVAGDYLKHVVLKYIEYCQKGDLKSQSLVPVLCTLLNLSPAERRLVEHSSVPSPLLHINQAQAGSVRACSKTERRRDWALAAIGRWQARRAPGFGPERRCRSHRSRAPFLF